MWKFIYGYNIHMYRCMNYLDKTVRLQITFKIHYTYRLSAHSFTCEIHSDTQSSWSTLQFCLVQYLSGSGQEGVISTICTATTFEETLSLTHQAKSTHNDKDQSLVSVAFKVALHYVLCKLQVGTYQSMIRPSTVNYRCTQ